MPMDKILFVGGTWDDEGGKSSSYIAKLINAFNEQIKGISYIYYYNGGYYNDLQKVLNASKDFDTVLWFASVPNEYSKVRDVKEINPKAMFVNSKRNDNGKYDFQVLIARALKQKANLTVEFRKNEDGVIEARVFDPLGTVWSDFTSDLNITVSDLIKRLNFIIDIDRESLKQRLDFDGTPLPKLSIPHNVPDELFTRYREFGNTFHDLIHPAEETTRFLGNMSFRCERGFPSFRYNHLVYVSERNVDKKNIDRDNFVAVMLEDDQTYYFGDKKPSVDTPVQVRLYSMLSDVNYMLHAHVYVKNAPFTSTAIPCGGLQEIDEIMFTIKRYNLKGNFCINLIGHGCLIFANDYHYFDKVEFVGRPIPEIIE